MSSGKPLIGWIGLDAPVEVLAAIGAPVRLDADPASPSPEAVPFGEGGGNPAMRATANKVLEAAGVLQRVVIGSMPVTGVWLYNFFLTLENGQRAPDLPPLDLVNISHEDRPSSDRLNRDSIGGLARRLEAAPDALREAIRERNAVRSFQRRIDVLRFGEQPRLTGTEARRLLDAADRMDHGAYVGLAQEALGRAPAFPAADMAPVLYSGPGSPSLDLYAALEAQGLTVVGDDADFGSRAIGPDVDESIEPVEALARRYARRDPAPAGWTTRQRVDWLTGMARARGAQAVVFDLPPWSHPPAWDLPAQRRALEAMGVACIVLPQAGPEEAAAEAAGTLRTHRAGRRAHV